MALTDDLTGLHTYRSVSQRAEAEVSRATRHCLALSRLFVDDDRFKLVNDTDGHPVGDQGLKAVADLRREGVEGDSVIIRIRGSDVIARYGGEEFAVLRPMTRPDGALVTGERVDDGVRDLLLDQDPAERGSAAAMMNIACTACLMESHRTPARSAGRSSR